MADAAENPVNELALFVSVMSQVMVLAAAPLVHVGEVNVTSRLVTAGNVPPPVPGPAIVTLCNCPVASKPTVPLASVDGVPAVPPVTSAPSTVIAQFHAPAPVLVYVSVVRCDWPSES